MSLTLASRAAVVVAVATPFLIGATSSPSSTYFNQAWAAGAWGLLLWGLGGRCAGPSDAARGRTLALVVAAMALFILAGLPGPTPWGQRLIPLAAAATVAVLAVWAAQAAAGARAPGGRATETLWPGLMAALLVAGLLSTLVATVQLFFPASADGLWIAHATTPGRAIGNIRQPNQLSTLLLWGAAAAGWWTARRGASAVWLAAALLPLVAAVAMTASRTGTVGVVLLAAWGLIDRRLPGRLRVVLIGSLAAYALAWVGLSAWADQGGEFYGRSVVDKTLHGDASSSRGGIWRDTLGLIAGQPWAGVGLGAFNFAWSTSVFPQRPVAFFDHTHNLPLQLAVELGVPVAVGILGLLGAAVWRARRGLTDADPATALDARTALFMLVMVGVHSQLEYPLWYLYFLFPAAVMLGHLLGQTGAPARAPTDDAPGFSGHWGRGLAVAGTLLASATVWSAVQYHHVRVIFEPERSWGEPMSLEARIARGQGSVLFGQHADYAQVTMAERPGALLPRFERTRFHLLDTRLLSAWATAQAEQGDLEAAAHLSARLREFRNPASAPFFAPCADPATAAVAFQCLPDPRLDWRALLQRP
jgi:O-antigen ligase